MVTNGQLSMTWSAEIGNSYQLQFISELGATNWTNLGPVLAASGSTLTATDVIANASARFYRIVLQP
jgi:hypothetical protein